VKPAVEGDCGELNHGLHCVEPGDHGETSEHGEFKSELHRVEASSSLKGHTSSVDFLLAGIIALIFGSAIPRRDAMLCLCSSASVSVPDPPSCCAILRLRRLAPVSVPDTLSCCAILRLRRLACVSLGVLSGRISGQAYAGRARAYSGITAKKVRYRQRKF
jgi:hypothetical protein